MKVGPSGSGNPSSHALPPSLSPRMMLQLERTRIVGRKRSIRQINVKPPMSVSKCCTKSHQTLLHSPLYRTIKLLPFAHRHSFTRLNTMLRMGRCLLLLGVIGGFFQTAAAATQPLTIDRPQPSQAPTETSTGQTIKTATLNLSQLHSYRQAHPGHEKEKYGGGVSPYEDYVQAADVHEVLGE